MWNSPKFNHNMTNNLKTNSIKKNTFFYQSKVGLLFPRLAHSNVSVPENFIMNFGWNCFLDLPTLMSVPEQ